MKRCSKCGEEKAREEFYKGGSKANGLHSACKECHKDDVAKYRANNLERERERNRKYNKTPERRAAVRRWERENLLEYAAQHKLRNAVEHGKITKPLQCSLCPAIPAILQGHHYDYSKPLDVVWCCAICHKAIHKERIFTGSRGSASTVDPVEAYPPPPSLRTALGVLS